MRFSLLAAALLAGSAAAGGSGLMDALRSYTAAGKAKLGGKQFGEPGTPITWLGGFLEAAHSHVSELMAQGLKERPGVSFAQDAFYAWIPSTVGAVPVSGAKFSWSGNCFAQNVATASLGLDSVTLTITSGAPTTTGCSDIYLLGNMDWLSIETISAPGTVNVTLPANFLREGLSTWIHREGVRVFLFPTDDALELLASLLDTISLYVPCLTSIPLSDGCKRANLAFLSDHLNYTTSARATPNIAASIPESYFDTGDVIAIQRLDGLGTLEDWGTGAVTSHLAYFIRDDSTGDLYVYESTDATAFWAAPNIQRTLWKDWVPLAVAADYAVVHLPLSDAVRATLNRTAVKEFADSQLGNPYGYANFIATFYDTESDNLPPPATPEALEVIFGVVDGLDESITRLILTRLLAVRVGVNMETASLLDAINAAAAMNLTMGQAIAIPEVDGVVYINTGTSADPVPASPSRVCDVYVAAGLKAGGIYGSLASQINTNEMDNSGVYQSTFYNFSRALPPACASADPNLPYCQMLGEYQLRLPGLNTLKPYAHMLERCESLPPFYARTPTGC